MGNFLGTGWAFPPRFDARSGSAETLSGRDLIEQGLRIILTTPPGERITNPAFGCDLTDFVFERNDLSVRTMTEDAIRSAIVTYEPRIEVHDVTVDSSDALDGTLSILLDYSIRQTNSRHNAVFPFSISEGTGLR